MGWRREREKAVRLSPQLGSEPSEKGKLKGCCFKVCLVCKQAKQENG